MAAVRKTCAARRDLLDIWRYLDRSASTEVATALLLRVEQVAEGLAEMPFSAQERPELGEGIRSRPVERYVLFYRPIPKASRSCASCTAAATSERT